MKPVSKHSPIDAGDIVTVPSSGSLLVDTGLRAVQTFSATLAQDSATTAASVSASLVAPTGEGNYQLLIKTWAADGTTAGSSAANVAWYALGK